MPAVAGYAVDRADRQLRHPGRRGVVARAEDQRLDPRRGDRDPLDLDEAARRLDLDLDPDRRRFGRLELGRGAATTTCTCAALSTFGTITQSSARRPADDREQVVAPPGRADGVDAHRARRRRPLLPAQRARRRACASSSFFELGRDRVLEVEEDLVGGERPAAFASIFGLEPGRRGRSGAGDVVICAPA